MAKALSVDTAHRNQNSGRVNITTSLPVYVFNLASVSVFYIIKVSGSTVKVELLLNPPFALIPLPAVSGQLHLPSEQTRQAAVARSRKSPPPSGWMYLRHLLLQLWQSAVRSEVIPPTLSDSKGEVCNEKQELPLPGGAAIASSYIANVQICFSLEEQHLFSALGTSDHTRDCPPLLARRQVQKMCGLTTLASRQTLIKSGQLIQSSEKQCILHCHSQLRVRTGSRSDSQCDTHSLMLTEAAKAGQRQHKEKRTILFCSCPVTPAWTHHETAC